MSRDLTTPLGRILAQAVKLPAATGDADVYRRRFAGASNATVLLCDVSGSMDESASGRKKIEHLREAVGSVLPNCPGARIITFASAALDIPTPGQIPEPSGGTAMHLGLDAAALSFPRRTVVISDGLPDNQESALAAAERLTGTIDVIYCGPDSDADAIAFMRRLARVGGGRVVVHDVRRPDAQPLAQVARQVLALPSPKGR